MPFKCCVPGCKSGYASQKTDIHPAAKISFHRFPLKDFLKNQWLRKIPRKFTPSSNSRVCSLHFTSADFIDSRYDKDTRRRIARGDRKRKTLRDDAVPSIFPNLPSYLSSTPTTARDTSSTAEGRRQKQSAKFESEAKMFLEGDNVNSISDLKSNLQTYIIPNGFHVLIEDQSLLIVKLVYNDNIPTVTSALKINSDMSFVASVNGKLIPYHTVIESKNPRFETCSQVVNALAILAALQNDDKNDSDCITTATVAMERCRKYLTESKETKLNFLIEQLQLINLPPKARRYSTSLMTTAFLWHAYGPKVYENILDDNLLSLPSVRHLQRLSAGIKTSEGPPDVSYVTARVEQIPQHERKVILLIDEIYIAKKVELKRGEFFGMTEDGFAKTLLCFMVKSLKGKFQDMVSIYPVAKLNSKFLKKAFTEVMDKLYHCGLVVLALSVDNAPTNRSFYVKELCNGNLSTSIQHPHFPDTELFLLFDSSHNVKNVYNNFLNRRSFIMPKFSDSESKLRADFQHLLELYTFEKDRPLKMGHKINPTVLNPTTLQRTSMKLCTSVFSESTVAALNYYSENNGKQWFETAEFLRLILKLWNVLNVKSVNKGHKKRNIEMEPINGVTDWKLSFIREIVVWLSKWQQSKQSGLSSETFLALKHTCQAVVDLSENLLLHHDFQYILTGTFLSDPIEKRFGWYRQLSGGNYYISVNQVLENEKKIRIISLLKFSHITASDISVRFSTETDIPSDESLDMIYECVRDLEIDDVVDNADLNIIMYVAGYVARSVERNKKCIHCSSMLCTSDRLPTPSFLENLGESDAFFNIVNRGGLTKPSDCVFSFLTVCFAVFQVLCKDDLHHRLLLMTNVQFCFIEIVMRKIRDCEYFSSINPHLECGHSLNDLLRLLSRQFFNCMGKNWRKT